MRRAVAALALLLAPFLARGAAAADLVYLHVEANEGGSSGGHVALQVGDTVYHYQHESPGVLRLQRDAPARFDRRYRLLENRTVHATHVDVDDDTASRIAGELTRRHLVESQQRACHASLAADVRLLAAMDGEPVDVVVPGAGLFADDGAEPALVALRARLDAIDAPAVHARLAALAFDAVPPPAPPTAGGEAPCYGWARRYEDGLAMLRAHAVLASTPALHAGAVRETSLVLRDGEPAVLAAHREALVTRIGKLARSSRPGAGTALLAGMARLAALERTLAGGRWIVLDAYPADAPALAPDVVRARRDVVDALIPLAGRDVDDARAALMDAAPEEGALAEVETAINRFAELLDARDRERPLRIQTGPLLPQRGAAAPVLPSVPPGVAASLATARARAAAYEDALTALRRYRLITRNCVTELFDAIDAAMGTPLDARRRLGGQVDGALAFVPFVAAAHVGATWRVTAREERPSHRRLRLAALPDGVARARERTVPTSTIYRRNPDDSIFLFFTDDAVATRPLFGLANLAAGVGASVAGLATLPFDGGALLRDGFWGAFWSVPELAFVNVRKGTFALAHDIGTSNTSTSAAVRAVSAIDGSPVTAAPSPASSARSPS